MFKWFGSSKTAAAQQQNTKSTEKKDIKIEELRDLVYKALVNKGHRPSDAEVITEILIWAEIRGNTQSVIKIPTKGVEPIEGAGEVVLEHDTPVSARLHSHNRPGMVVLTQACDLAVEKAKKSSIGIVGIHGSPGSTGAIGYFARKISQQGFICLVMSQSHELMAPHNGIKPLYGTNPIAYGIPRRDGKDPLVFDGAMSGISLFGVQQAKAAGEQLPENVALDKDGNPTTDPAAALEGALRTFDCGAKGSHLALLVELIGGAWAGGDVLDKRNRANWGSLVIVLDPGLLGAKEEFLTRVEEFCERYKAQESQDGRELMLPGERGEAVRAKNEAAGYVTLPENVIEDLKELAGEKQKEEEHKDE